MGRIGPVRRQANAELVLSPIVPQRGKLGPTLSGANDAKAHVALSGFFRAEVARRRAALERIRGISAAADYPASRQG